jgi:hypothetical protein
MTPSGDPVLMQARSGAGASSMTVDGYTDLQQVARGYEVANHAKTTD